MKKTIILITALLLMLCMLFMSGCELLSGIGTPSESTPLDGSPIDGSSLGSAPNIGPTTGDVISTDGPPFQSDPLITGPYETWHPDYDPSESKPGDGEKDPDESNHILGPGGQKPIVHQFVNNYRYDYDNHWKYCNHCDEIDELAPHELNYQGRCTVCNFRVDAKLLIIESVEGQSAALVEALDGNVMVEVMQISSEERFPLKSGEMAPYDGVILLNVSKEDMPKNFEAYVLKPYLDKYGGNLLTVCGNKKDGDDPEVNAFTPSDIEDSILGEILPVEIVERPKKSAVIFIVDVSSTMFDPYEDDDYEKSRLHIANEFLNNAIKSFDDNDRLGIYAYAGDVMEVIGMENSYEYDGYRPDLLLYANGGSTYGLSHAIGRAGVILNDMTDVDAKHIVVLSDGVYPEGEEYNLWDSIRQNAEYGITLSYVGVDPGSSIEEKVFSKLDTYIERGQYNKSIIRSLDEIDGAIEEIREKFLCENIAEKITFVPGVGKGSPIFEGVNPEDVPELYGYYFCKLKEGAEALMTYGDHPIYARHTLKEGARVGSFMCDLNGIWSSELLNSEAGRRIINNIIKDVFIYKK